MLALLRDSKDLEGRARVHSDQYNYVKMLKQNFDAFLMFIT